MRADALRTWIGLPLLAMALGASAQAVGAEPPPVPVGVATVDITPSYPVRMTGYESRKTESEGVETPLKAKALAIGGDVEGPCVLVTVDNCGVPAKVVDAVAGRLAADVKLPRERFVVCSAHTHSAPALGGALPVIFGGPLPADQQARIDRYTAELTVAIEKVARAALAARKPGRLAYSVGSVPFAANRRVLKDGRWAGFGVNPTGPTDKGLPVLRVTNLTGAVRVVMVGYACHCTTLGGEFNRICGDWAGYASAAIEKENPGATALVVIGCGGDANPEPRLTLDNARQHGATVAHEFARLQKGAWKPLTGQIAPRFRRIELPFTPNPSRDELVKRSKAKSADGYLARMLIERLDRGETLPTTLPYPVQTWCFGDNMAMVFLGGEVVVDYALRLYYECEPGKIWVAAYSNDVPCYIASRRVLSEGGYEADFSMTYYGRPSRLAPEVEDVIVNAVHDLLPDAFDGAKAR
jgi:neutral ceramidase